MRRRGASTAAWLMVLLLAPPGGHAQAPLAQAPHAQAPQPQTADIAAGERLYRLGIRADGSQLQARRPPVDSVVSGAAAACVACHRRSGMGMQEGRSLAPPVAGAILFAPGLPTRPGRPVAAAGARRGASAPAVTRQAARHLARAAYDVASLTRALRDGVDPNGKPLDSLMPRYALDKAEVAQLAAYLNRLDPQQSSGLDEAGLIQLATVITPDAPDQRSATVVETLQRWANAVALRGRRVRLQVWQLDGPATTWRAQLERHQREQPVYAVVSGAGRAEWGPVQAFCEASHLPCILPLIDRLPDAAGDPAMPAPAAGSPIPDTAGDDPYFSLYFSGGVEAEAQLAARYLAALPSSNGAGVGAGAATLLQVHAPGDALGGAAARRFAATWPDSASLRSLELNAQGPQASERLLAALAGLAGAAPEPRLLLWVEPAQLKQWVARFPDGMPAVAGQAGVLVSAQLTPAQALALPPPWQRQLAWASLKSDPTRLRGGQAMAMANWLSHLGLAAQPGSEQAEVYAAAFFLGDALARMRLGWSQTWLMEQLESVVNNRPAGAAYYSLSLGPGQRVAAKVGRLLVVAPADGPAQALPWQDRLMPVSELIRADD